MADHTNTAPVGGGEGRLRFWISTAAAEAILDAAATLLDAAALLRALSRHDGEGTFEPRSLALLADALANAGGLLHGAVPATGELREGA